MTDLWKVRKRSSAFPSRIGTRTEAPQPLALVHTDFSDRGAAMKLERRIARDVHLRSRTYDMLK